MKTLRILLGLLVIIVLAIIVIVLLQSTGAVSFSFIETIRTDGLITTVKNLWLEHVTPLWTTHIQPIFR